MEDKCFHCVLMYRCTCQSLQLCKHSLKYHTSSPCNPRRSFTWKTHEEFQNQKNYLKLAHLSNIIQEIIKTLKSHPIPIDSEQLKLRNSFKFEPELIQDYSSLFFFKERELKRFKPTDNTLASIKLNFEYLSYVSICTSLHKVFLVGGTDLDCFNPVKTVYSLNLKKNTYKKLPDLQVPVYLSASVVLNDELFVIGGKKDKNSKISLIQVINLLTETVKTLNIEEFKCNNISAVVFQQNICYNSGDSDLNFIDSDGTPVNSFQIDRRYGKIVALASSADSLFIMQENCILRRFGQSDMFANAQLKVEWMQQAPLFYENKLFLLDYNLSKIFELNINHLEFKKFEKGTSDESFPEDSNEYSEDSENHQRSLESRPGASYSPMSSLNISTVDYS